MLSYESSDINKYIKDKLKMLREFSVHLTDDEELEIKSMTSKSEVDRRCRTLIEDHVDKINDLHTSINLSNKRSSINKYKR